MTGFDLFGVDDSRQITRLCNNTNQVIANSCFFCTTGVSADRHDFVDTAIEKGAICIVHSKPFTTYYDHILYIKVDDVQKELVRVADLYYGDPSRHLTLYGITGTNGKTSTAVMIYDLLKQLKVKAGYMGTVAIRYDDIELPAKLTTPDIIEFRELLSDMVNHQIDSVAIEVSSQGLSLGRVDNIDFDVVGFTNLTQDHLDYHKNMEAYFNAKKRLFDQAKPSCIMVINEDDEYGQRLIHTGYTQSIVTYGTHPTADYQAADIKLFDDHTEFKLIHKHQSYDVYSSRVARFNVYNLVLAIAMIHNQTHVSLQEIVSAAATLSEITGRVNFLDYGQDFKVIVDYSHTPDGMEKMYQYCKDIINPNNKVIAVFGSAGGRDHDKRPMMGQVSDAYCDVIVLTEDDPRSESVLDIAHDIKTGITKTETIIEPNRYLAIKNAIMRADPGDIVVIMGKGLETYQHGPSGKEPWMGDPDAVKQSLEEKNEHTQ
ncbi:hypothetical protein AOC36_05165 [Erysipelothrix larvae]|uniref:UDP-N-acetylmuramyl-tripeptide synthetase n=1 Tax=Erysipelothrix larvae TaxID=1514105 RepID=A0A109UGY0_9FIRM|nr:UDP-N-acetylmuramoyl-L-alanyl-D-glutamate--2,6-diaminopimelate ligase [Erysipelothrix larvae]AMC93388.1 hypothetical protein AOC36_05165 [Erysipelothrix larvae]